MSSKSKSKRTTGMSARQFLTAGMGSAAVVGAGLLSAGLLDDPATATAAPEVQLMSTESELSEWWLLNAQRSGGNDSANSNALFGPSALAATSANGNFNLFRPIGPGGWLIGNGIDAVAGCEGAACNGGNAGLLFGNGGKGFAGGHGGNGALYFLSLIHI